MLISSSHYDCKKLDKKVQTCIFNKLLFIAVNVKGETKQTKQKKKRKVS